MKYISTRGGSPKLNFSEVLLGGLAPDGGLYLPEYYPKFKDDELNAMRDMSYQDLAFHIFEKEPETLNVFSVSKAHKNPYFNMVEQDENGYVHLCKPLNQSVYSRQSAPEVFEMNASFYIFRNEYFKLNKDSVFTKKTRPFIMDHICFDIDETLDFEFMEFLVKNQKLDFEI